MCAVFGLTGFPPSKVKFKHGYQYASSSSSTSGYMSFFDVSCCVNTKILAQLSRGKIVGIRRNRFGKYIVSHLDLRLQSWVVLGKWWLFVEDEDEDDLQRITITTWRHVSIECTMCTCDLSNYLWGSSRRGDSGI